MAGGGIGMNTDFKDIEISDRQWVNSLLSYSDYRSTEYNFTVLYIWKDTYKTKIARLDDFLLIRSGECETGFAYIFPAGRGEIKKALDFIMEDAAGHNSPFILVSVLEEQKKILEELYPGRFSYTPARNSFDYVYSAMDLITLKGKKFQSKRNFVSRFKSNPDWAFEPVNKENLQECMQMNEEWCKLYGCTKESSLAQESCSVRCALKNFEALSLKGGLLRLSGKVVAFSIGEMLNSDTFLVHIEKAFADIQGAYPTISREFLLHCSNLDENDIQEADQAKIGFRYVNREDDAGDEGLRKAKLQYHPVFMIEKYIVAESEK